MLQPFVGVCGIQDTFEFNKLLYRAPTVLAGTDAFIMAGIKQVTDDIVIRVKSDAVRPFVHCDFTSQAQFEQLVARTIRQSRHFVRGLQLNVLPWMDVNFAPLWRTLKRQYPDIALVLQAHKATMTQYTPQQIAERLRGLPIDYLLFDASQSRGTIYDLEDMRAYVDAARTERPSLGIVVAGGLSAPVMSSHFAPLLGDYSIPSCDAFGQLQSPVTHALSWLRVDAYLAAWKQHIASQADIMPASNPA
jgi:hypothetical protein